MASGAPGPSGGAQGNAQPAQGAGSEGAGTQPQGQPGAGGGQGQSSDGLPPTEATGKDGIEIRGGQEQRAARPIRPIPPAKVKQVLPGVEPDAEDVRATEATDFPRGPDGRFVPKAEGEPAIPPKPGELEPPKRFKFAGEEFDTQEAAEQNFKSLRGQFKPLVERMTAAESHLTKAAESARGWKAEFDRVSAELEALKQGRPQSQPADHQQPTEEQQAEEGIDWELYAEIHRLATEKGEPWKAEQWLVNQQQKLFEQRIARLADEVTAPQREVQLREQIGQQTEALFTTLADYVNADGSPAYPELSDPQAAYQIGRFWTSLGLPREAAFTPQGAVAAIALYRMAQAQGSQGSPAPTPAPPAPPSAPAPPSPQALAAAAAAGLDGGRPSAVPRNGEGNLSPEAARIVAGLKQATLTRPGLGFEP